MAGIKTGNIRLKFNNKVVNERTLTEVIFLCNEVFNNADNMLFDGENLNNVYGYIARKGIILEFEEVEWSSSFLFY